MKQMVEVGAVIASAEIVLPVAAMTAAGTGVATLGIESAPLDTAVIGGVTNTAPYPGQVGYNVMRTVENYSWVEHNVPWLNNIIRLGQPVEVLPGGAGTAAEGQYLQDVGKYLWEGSRLVKP